jgi:hypothetical protein
VLKIEERPYSILQKSVAKSRLLENAIDSRMRIKTITYSDVLAKALPVLLARTFAHRYSVCQKSVAKSPFLENGRELDYGEHLRR